MFIASVDGDFSLIHSLFHAAGTRSDSGVRRAVLTI